MRFGLTLRLDRSVSESIIVRRTLLTVFAELAMGKIDGKTLNPFFSKSAGQISFVGSVVEKRTINRFLAVPSLNFAYFFTY